MALARLHSTRDFFRILCTWKKQSITIFIGIVFIIMSFAYMYTPDYKTSAKILILPKTTEEVVLAAGKYDNRVLPVETEDINTEIELLTSAEVIRATVQSFVDESSKKSSNGRNGLGLKAQKDSWMDSILDKVKHYINEFLIFLKLRDRLSPFDTNVALLTSSIEVEPVAMSNIILITLTAEMPKVATIVLNRMLDIYIEHHNKSLTKEGGVPFLHKEAQAYYDKLEDAEMKVKDFQKKWNIVDIKKQIDTNINLLADFTQDLKRNELAQDAIKSRIVVLKEDMAKNEQDFVVTRDMRAIPAVIELEKSIIPLLVTRSEMQKTFILSSRELRDMENQIVMLKKEIRNEIIKAVKTDEMEIESLRVQHDSLKNQITMLQAENSVLNREERNLAALEREANMLENNYKLYAAKTEDARIYREQKNQDLANVHIADKAVVPVKPSFPNRLLMLFVSVFVGFFAAIGTPFFLEYLDHRIKTSGEVEDLLSLPVVCYFTDEK